MNGQPNQGIASLTGGMGGSPTLGGAPQTPPMPQGAQKPQPTPQGGLPPDLLKALAMARVKKLQDAAKRDLELKMAQQQAASGEDKKTVVQQMEEGVEKGAMDEIQKTLTEKLSGGVQKAAPQPSPMAGGIASAPGANQAAQPEAMASGGIVAFDEGGEAKSQFRLDRLAKEEDAAAINKRNQDLIELQQAMQKQGLGYYERATPEERKLSESKVAALKNAYEYLKGYDPKAAAKPAAVNQDRPEAPARTAADDEDMRGFQGGIPTTLPRPSAQRPPVAAIQQTQRPPAAVPTLPTAPTAPAPDALQQKLQAGISGLLDTDETVAATKAREDYQRMVPQDQGLVDQRKKDSAALRAALEKQNAPLDWSDRLSAMAQGAMGGVRGGSNWMSEGVAGGAKLRGLEAAHAAKQAENLGVLKGMSEEDYNRDIALKEKIYGVGSEAAKAAKATKEKAMQSGVTMAGNQTQERTAYAQMANDLVRQGMSNASAKEIAGMNAAASAAATAAMRESNNMGKLQAALNTVTNNQAKAAQEIRNDFAKRFDMLPQYTGDPDSNLSKQVKADRTALQTEQNNAIAVAIKPFEEYRKSLESKILDGTDGGTSGFKVVGKRQQ
jgi:hypothetical protein